MKALLYSERSYHILLAGRDINKAQNASKVVSSEIDSASTVEALQVDVEDDESISEAFKSVSSKHTRIDCLINNAGRCPSCAVLPHALTIAGATYDPHVLDGRMTSREAFAKMWNVNVTGAHIMTQTFLPLLLKSDDPRLLFNTSGLSSLEHASDTSSPRYQVPPAGLPKGTAFASIGYKSSKAGLNMLMVDWTRILKNDGVKVWCIAPGLLATGLGGNPELLKKMGAKDPQLGGEAIRGVVEGKRDADVGKVVREYDTPTQPW